MTPEQKRHLKKIKLRFDKAKLVYQLAKRIGADQDIVFYNKARALDIMTAYNFYYKEYKK